MGELAIVVDTETGSTDITKAAIVQIAGVVVTPKGNFNTLMSTYCKPDPKKVIEDGAIEVHGITPDMYKWSPKQSWALQFLDLAINTVAETNEVFLVGHNADRYDLPLMQLSDPKAKFDQYPSIDTLLWSRRLYPEGEHKLGLLYTDLFDKPAVEAHDAAADCYMCGEILLHMLKETGMTMMEAAIYLDKPRPYKIFPFGKYKGQPLDKVPKAYLIWVDKNFNDPDIDMQATLHKYLVEEK